jgi:hypothetical protein
MVIPLESSNFYLRSYNIFIGNNKVSIKKKILGDIFFFCLFFFNGRLIATSLVSSNFSLRSYNICIGDNTVVVKRRR